MTWYLAACQARAIIEARRQEAERHRLAQLAASAEASRRQAAPTGWSTDPMARRADGAPVAAGSVRRLAASTVGSTGRALLRVAVALDPHLERRAGAVERRGSGRDQGAVRA